MLNLLIAVLLSLGVPVPQDLINQLNQVPGTYTTAGDDDSGGSGGDLGHIPPPPPPPIPGGH